MSLSDYTSSCIFLSQPSHRFPLACTKLATRTLHPASAASVLTHHDPPAGLHGAVLVLLDIYGTYYNWYW